LRYAFWIALLLGFVVRLWLASLPAIALGGAEQTLWADAIARLQAGQDLYLGPKPFPYLPTWAWLLTLFGGQMGLLASVCDLGTAILLHRMTGSRLAALLFYLSPCSLLVAGALATPYSLVLFLLALALSTQRRGVALLACAGAVSLHQACWLMPLYFLTRAFPEPRRRFLAWLVTLVPLALLLIGFGLPGQMPLGPGGLANLAYGPLGLQVGFLPFKPTLLELLAAGAAIAPALLRLAPFEAAALGALFLFVLAPDLGVYALPPVLAFGALRLDGFYPLVWLQGALQVALVQQQLGYVALPGVLAYLADLRTLWLVVLTWLGWRVGAIVSERLRGLPGAATAGEVFVVAGLAAIAVGCVVAVATFGLAGTLRDDGEYLLYARELLRGHGWINPALPGHAVPSRFPIGFPALLALVGLGAADPWVLTLRAQILELFTCAGFVVLAHLYFRRQARLDRGLSLALTAIVAFGAYFLSVTTYVVADIPFACAGLLAVIAFERARRWPHWLLVGLLIGAATLIRTAGISLLAAAVLALLWPRRPGALVALLAGAGALLGPWTLYSRYLGSESYTAYSQGYIPQSFAQILGNLLLSIQYLLNKALPGLVAYYLINETSVLGFLLGLVLLTLLGRGVWLWLQRPGPSLAPWYVVTTLGLAIAYNVLFTFYGDYLLGRLLEPVLPLMLVAWVLAFRELLQPVSPRWRVELARGCLAVAVVSNGLALWSIVRAGHYGREQDQVAREYRAVFDAVNRESPKEALLVAPFNAMVTLYTDRRCLQFKNTTPTGDRIEWGMTPAGLLSYLAKNHIDYIVAVPHTDHVTHRDVTRETVVVLEQGYPGLLDLRYVNERGTYALFKVNPKELARLTAPVGGGLRRRP
jgi:hypothetical protein